MAHDDTILLRYTRENNEKFIRDGEYLREHLGGELGCRDIGRMCLDYSHAYIHLVDARKLKEGVYFRINSNSRKPSTKLRILHLDYSTLERIAQRWGFKAEMFDSIPAAEAGPEEPWRERQWD